MLGATFSITGHQPLTDTPMMADYAQLDQLDRWLETGGW
jgi:2-hydroxychromene-2-carboxylate isomerase